MNQILYTQEKRNSNPLDTKKVVLFFAICIIVFGLILLGQGVYTVYQDKKNAKANPNVDRATDAGNSGSAEITFTKTEDNKVIINIVSQTELSYISYNWDNETPKTVDATGKTRIEETIDIPGGENNLNVSVVDTSGKETKKQESFTIEISKPIIELSVVGNKIKISVTSNTDLSYVTYKWNSDKETKEDMLTYENKTKFEKTLDIPKGQNTLNIVAVDFSQNKTEKSQDIKGITKAKTSVTVQEKYLNFTVTAEENIKTVEFEFNGKKYMMNTDTFGETKEVKYKQEMIKGMNYLKIISTTQSGAIDTSVWKYEYKAK